MGHGLTMTDEMFSVREMPWHGLGVVLDEPPSSIDDALDKAGLGWRVKSAEVLVERRAEWRDDFGNAQPAEVVPAERPDGSRYQANVREDTGDLLGIVTQDYNQSFASKPQGRCTRAGGCGCSPGSPNTSRSGATRTPPTSTSPTPTTGHWR